MPIFQSDLIIRSSLIRALAFIRANPYYLDDIFSQTVTDTLLKDEFGYKEIQRAKNWFLQHNIPVIMSHRLEKDAQFPCITISIENSVEEIARTVMSDSGFVEDVPYYIDESQIVSQPMVIIGPFTPVSYDPATGIIVLPDGFTTEWVVSGQFLKDTRNNRTYEIINRTCDKTFTIAKNLNADFTNAVILPRFAGLRTKRDRTYFRETYSIACHVKGDATELIWLHSIVLFCLLRFKNDLLQSRCLELSTFSAGPMMKAEFLEMDNIYSRFISFNGIVEQSWINEPMRNIEGITVDSVKIADATATPDGYKDDIEEQQWYPAADDEDIE